MFRPVARWPAASIASCKVTAVKFSAPPLNFSGIPIYSAPRIYLFRASSLSLSLSAFSLTSREEDPSFLRYPRPLSLSHARTPFPCSQFPFPPSLPSFSPPFSLRFSISLWLTRNSVQIRAAESRAGERVHVRRAFVAHARL